MKARGAPGGRAGRGATLLLACPCLQLPSSCVQQCSARAACRPPCPWVRPCPSAPATTPGHHALTVTGCRLRSPPPPHLPRRMPPPTLSRRWPWIPPTPRPPPRWPAAPPSWTPSQRPGARPPRRRRRSGRTRRRSSGSSRERRAWCARVPGTLRPPGGELQLPVPVPLSAAPATGSAGRRTCGVIPNRLGRPRGGVAGCWQGGGSQAGAALAHESHPFKGARLTVAAAPPRLLTYCGWAPLPALRAVRRPGRAGGGGRAAGGAAVRACTQGGSPRARRWIEAGEHSRSRPAPARMPLHRQPLPASQAGGAGERVVAADLPTSSGPGHVRARAPPSLPWGPAGPAPPPGVPGRAAAARTGGALARRQNDQPPPLQGWRPSGPTNCGRAPPSAHDPPCSLPRPAPPRPCITRPQLH